MEKATDEHNRKNGYVKDPRVPEQPGTSDRQSVIVCYVLSG